MTQKQQTLPAVEGTPDIAAELIALRDALLDGLDEDARDGALEEAATLVAKAGEAEVNDRESYDRVGLLRNRVVLSQQTLEEIWHPSKHAAHQLHRRIIQLEKIDTKDLALRVGELNSLITDWERAQRQEAERVRLEAVAKQQEEQRKRQEAAEAGKPVPPAEVPLIPTVEPEPNVAVGVIITYSCKVVDEAALPREWWLEPRPNQEALDRHYRETQGSAKVPGCEAVEHSHPRRR